MRRSPGHIVRLSLSPWVEFRIVVLTNRQARIPTSESAALSS